MAPKHSGDKLSLSQLSLEVSGTGALKALGEVAASHLRSDSQARSDAEIIGKIIRKANGS